MRQNACLGITQSRLITLLLSLTARRLVVHQTQRWAQYKACWFIYLSWLGLHLVVSVAWSFGIQLVVFSVFQWYYFTPYDSPGVIIRFCRVLISDSSEALFMICFFPTLIH